MFTKTTVCPTSSFLNRSAWSHSLAVQVTPILPSGRQDFKRMLHVGTRQVRFLGADTRVLWKKGYMYNWGWLEGPTSQGCWPDVETDVLSQSTCFNSNFVHLVYLKPSVGFIWDPKLLCVPKHNWDYSISPLPHPFSPALPFLPTNHLTFIKYYV